MKKKTKPSQLTRALLETAHDMRRAGILDTAAHGKITLRHLDHRATATAKPMTGREIRALRKSARVSQAVFARYLNLTVGYVSQLERDAKQLTGPALVLLNVIRREGFDVVL